MRPLYGPRRKRKAKPLTRTCLTPGCGAVTASWKFLCDGCFHEIPTTSKRAICDARAGHAPHRIFGLSRDAAEWLVAHRAKLADQ
jgi:hypothetical protein